MIAHSILAAKKTGIFDKVVVSTDDAEIADVAKHYGAEIPFIRPESLSDDITGTVPVIAHAVDALMKSSFAIKNVCCIYATAPFIQPEDLIDGLKILKSTNADYAFSVTDYAFPIQRALKISQQKTVEMFFPEHYRTRSQDLEETFHDAGQFYWGTSEAWIKQMPIFNSFSVPVFLPRTRVQDIDTQVDWDRAEQLYFLLNR